MSTDMSSGRRLPVGAEILPEVGAHFRVWAPRAKHAAVHLEDLKKEVVLHAEPGGYFSGAAPEAQAGMLYRFRFDKGDLLPDPASRYQPSGPHGPSMLVDSKQFHWSDAAWDGSGLKGQILYELHIGTFTREGTWRAAADRLLALKEIGVTTVEIMPVAEFPGEFNWGYDGVNIFAPAHIYGTTEDFRSFVDHAHALELGVILDVVYNHFGPDGNYIEKFAPDFFTDRYENEWGKAINFDGDNSLPVREFFLANCRYWIEEYHLDGLRLDATQQIFDASPVHILQEIGTTCRSTAGRRTCFIVCENERQESFLARPVTQRGYGLDGLWNDDFHHSAVVCLTGKSEAYYTDYTGSPHEFLAAAKWGFLYQGQRYSWQKNRRGVPSLDLPPHVFVTFLENHDQVANSGLGLRLHQLSSPARFRAMTALLLLLPGTPMLFQGQEFNSTSPFLFFADHHTDLAPLVAAGRKEFLAQFPSLATEDAAEKFADPASRHTFERCKLREDERENNIEAIRLHSDLIQLRRSDPAFSSQEKGKFDGAVLGEHTLVMRFFSDAPADRLLVVNLGRQLNYSPAPEPLLAPPEGLRWHTIWSSENPIYGGGGTPELDTETGWKIPAESAVVLGAVPYSEV